MEEADESRHLKTVELLSDCKAVLVARIGPGAQAVLESNGIQAITIPDFIDEALKKLKMNLM